MDKVLVEVFLPAANQTYDIYVPKKSKIHEIIFLMGAVLSELSPGFFIQTSDLILYSQEKGRMLDINLSVEDHNLKNGAKLILI